MARPLRVAIVINPVAGVGGTLDRARRRAELAMDLLVAAQVDPEILITARAGHAAELARGAVDRGAHVVVAWGGDGTVNEVATALVGTSAALAVIPAGSGNGLARMLGMPADATRAIGRILNGSDRFIDVGDIDGHAFVNVAGVGFDAHIAGAFAAIGRARRGFLRYGAIVMRQLRSYECRTYTVALDPLGDCATTTHRAFLLTLCQRAPVGQRGHHRAIGRTRRRRAGGGGRGGPGPRGGVAIGSAIVRGHHCGRPWRVDLPDPIGDRQRLTGRFCITPTASRMSAVRHFESRSGPGHCDCGPDRADPPESFTQCLQRSAKGSIKDAL